MIPHKAKNSLFTFKKSHPKGSFPVISDEDDSLLSSFRHHHRRVMITKGKYCPSSRPSLPSFKSSVAVTASNIKKTCVIVPALIGSTINKNFSTTQLRFRPSWKSSSSSSSTLSDSSWTYDDDKDDQTSSSPSSSFFSFRKNKEDQYTVMDDTISLMDFMDDDGSEDHNGHRVLNTEAVNEI
jgi:hypothetical protein